MAATARVVVFLCVCLAACQIRGSHVPQKMNETIQNLLRIYNLPPAIRFNGHPVFSREPLSGKMEAQKVFFGSVLETYERLLGHMMKQQPTPSPQTAGNTGLKNNDDSDVRGNLSFILKKVQDLKKHKYEEQQTLLKNLQALKHIKMDNREVQSKALWELPWLYEQASLLSNDTVKQQRRRRQARRNKGRPRA